VAGYVFLGNSSKPSEEKRKSREEIVPGNVSIPCIEAALKLGYSVYLGTNRDNPQEIRCTYPVSLYDAHSYRSITAFKDNRIAYENLSEVVKKGDVEVIHCNTPVGGMIGRLVGKRYHVKKVIYTAHGFHFYKGAPLFNRTILKWAEQIMAHWTDAIITMNQEDYEAAQKFHLKKGGKVYKIHGVGITLSDYVNPNNRVQKRESLGLKDTDIAFISAGDLVQRKNYSIALEAIAEVNDKRIHYFICGVGPEKDNLLNQTKRLGIEDQIHFLGFRSDVKELFYAADGFLFTSLQEGLPRSLMEAMACGLSCIVSDIRGNVDLIDNGIGGYLCSPQDKAAFAYALKKLVVDSDLRRRMGAVNREKIKAYDVSVVKKEIEEIYREILL